MIRCRTAFAIATAAVLAAAPAAHAQYTGPSSSQSPYIVPTAPGWGVASILTVGDSLAFSPVPQMGGIPDGLGATGGIFNPATGTYVLNSSFMTVFMNHELGATVGAVRAHGQTGA